MNNVRVAASFSEDLSQIYSSSVTKAIEKNVRNLETSDFGLRKAPIVLIDQYGSHLRTIIISSFYLFYRVNEMENIIDVLHLVYARRELGSWATTD